MHQLPGDTWDACASRKKGSGWAVSEPEQRTAVQLRARVAAVLAWGALAWRGALHRAGSSSGWQTPAEPRGHWNRPAARRGLAEL
jgi:hypothetical protein